MLCRKRGRKECQKQVWADREMSLLPQPHPGPGLDASSEKKRLPCWTNLSFVSLRYMVSFSRGSDKLLCFIKETKNKERGEKDMNIIVTGMLWCLICDSKLFS